MLNNCVSDHRGPKLALVLRRVYVRGGGVNVPRGDVAVPPYADRGF